MLYVDLTQITASQYTRNGFLESARFSLSQYEYQLITKKYPILKKSRWDIYSKYDNFHIKIHI